MLRDILGLALAGALILAGVYAMPAVDLWWRECDAGVMVRGVGGYVTQWKGACHAD